MEIQIGNNKVGFTFGSLISLTILIIIVILLIMGQTISPLTLMVILAALALANLI